MLENCVPQLKHIELEHKDDNVKIIIRENLFYAPQYLISKIKDMINSLIFLRSIITFQTIQNNFMLTTNENFELEKIAQKFSCQIDRIDIENNNEIIKLPKTQGTSTIKLISKLVIQQSNQFLNTQTIFKRLSTSNDHSAIEIHKTIHSKIPIVSYIQKKLFFFSISILLGRCNDYFITYGCSYRTN